MGSNLSMNYNCVHLVFPKSLRLRRSPSNFHPVVFTSSEFGQCRTNLWKSDIANHSVRNHHCRLRNSPEFSN